MSRVGEGQEEVCVWDDRMIDFGLAYSLFLSYFMFGRFVLVDLLSVGCFALPAIILCCEFAL